MGVCSIACSWNACIVPNRFSLTVLRFEHRPKSLIEHRLYMRACIKHPKMLDLKEAPHADRHRDRQVLPAQLAEAVLAGP